MDEQVDRQVTLLPQINFLFQRGCGVMQCDMMEFYRGPRLLSGEMIGIRI